MWSIIEIFYKYDKQVVALHSCWLPGDVGRQGIGSDVCFSYPGMFRFQHHHYMEIVHTIIFGGREIFLILLMDTNGLI